MGIDRDRYAWIDDFSIVLRRDAIRRKAGDPAFEFYTGSKIAASFWLAIVSCIAGMLGGLLPSGILWSSFIYPAAWLFVVVGVGFAVTLLTIRLAGRSIVFLAGWCIFWGILTGIVAMWGAQLSSAGWAYGIAGGIGFLVGITEGLLEHADLEGHDSLYMTGTILAPTSICLAVWLNRQDLVGFGGFQQAALTGAIAASLFLGPVMALYMAKWKSRSAIFRRASVYLHHDDFVAEGIRLLNIAIRLTPDDAVLFDRRALAHALHGDAASAEVDWHQHKVLKKESLAPEISRGWVHLRRGSPELAATAFDKALSGKARPASAMVGRSICALRLDQPQQAIDMLGRLPKGERDARSLTYLAQAHFMLGHWQDAIGVATDAIEELDSPYGLTWLVCAEANLELGNNDQAILGFNRALERDQELGIEERALEGLEKVDGPVFEEDELEDFEKALSSGS